jgi:archaellum biogenesis protein FlaJ (TadC family)
VSSDPPHPAEGVAPEEAVAAAVEVLRPEDEATEASVQRQMDSLYTVDRWTAIAYVIALLVVLPFIVVAMWDFMPSTEVKVVLIGSALVLALYNCASMLALIRNYSDDRDFIYRRDVAHQRLAKAARKAGR